MAKKSKKLAKTEADYKRLRENLLKATREVRKKGFDIAMNLPTLSEAKKDRTFSMRKAINQMKKVSGKKTSNIKVVLKDTGEIFTLKEARKTINVSSQYYMKDKILAEIDTMPDYRDFYRYKSRRVVRIDFTETKQKVVDIMEDRIKEYGIAIYDKYLEDKINEFHYNVEVTIWDSEEENVRHSLVELISIVKGSPLTFEERMLSNTLSEQYES